MGVDPVCRLNTALKVDALEKPQSDATLQAGISVDFRREQAFLMRRRVRKSAGVRPAFSLKSVNTWVRE